MDGKERPHIFIVDDNPTILGLLKNILMFQNYETTEFTDSSEALAAIEKSPPDLILLDITMPGMDGYQLCSSLKNGGINVPVIFMSGLGSTEDKIRGFQAGGVDYITKPFYPLEVCARVSVHLNLRSMEETIALQKTVEKKILQTTEAQHATIFALAKLAEYRDEDTGAHLERVQQYCLLLAGYLAGSSSYADQISSEFIDCLYHASTLHDIGKVAIPDAILLKPSRLTDEEFEIMKSHTFIGASNMRSVFKRYPDNTFIGMGIEIAMYHHELWNGQGYPSGLSGTDIPLSARIMALADVYDALSSNRCYRKALPHEVVIKMISDANGTQFDPEIVAAFLALESDFKRIHDETTEVENPDALS